MNKKNINPWYQKALDLDATDPLSGYKDKFYSGETNMIYLDGNSLGKLPFETIELSSNLIKNQWGDRLIRSWNENWMELSSKLAQKIANVIGASADEVFVGDTTSINLYKLAFAAAQQNPLKKNIITDNLNFPTDLYVLQGLIENHFPTHRLRQVRSHDGMSVNLSDLEQKIDNQTAFISLSHVTYKSAFMYDMAKVNRLAHKHNSLVIWDLSHAAGAVPVQLNDTSADMAVGCTYKYLNGGPGAPAFLYVKKELQEKLVNPIWAWFSHRKPFDFDPIYKAGDGISRFACSTPSVLSLAAMEPGLNLILDAGMDKLRQKSSVQSSFLMDMIIEILVPLGFSVASPGNIENRGSHISISHPEGYRINRAMIEPKRANTIIIPDFRPPDNIRLGIAPLYNTFTDLYHCINRIQQIVIDKEYEAFSTEKLTVT